MDAIHDVLYRWSFFWCVAGCHFGRGLLDEELLCMEAILIGHTEYGGKGMEDHV